MQKIGQIPDEYVKIKGDDDLLYYEGVIDMLFIINQIEGCLFYYESRKRELKTRLIYEDRCDERLKN
jgi:hypothetical protein